MVEHAAVNRRVAGSSPARGAKPRKQFRGFFVLKRNCDLGSSMVEHMAVIPKAFGMQSLAHARGAKP